MISLLGSLLGFTTSFVPKILNHFTEKQQYRQQLALLKASSELKVTEARALAAIQQNKSIYQHDETITKNTTSNFINNLRSSVRPVISYVIFGTYVFYKIIVVVIALQESSDPLEAITSSYGQEDFGLLSTIVAFWFGSRLLR